MLRSKRMMIILPHKLFKGSVYSRELNIVKGKEVNIEQTVEEVVCF